MGTGKFPGYLSPSMGIKFADVPNGLGALSKVPLAGWGQILAYGAFCELSQKQTPGTPGARGDFGWKVLTSSDPEVVRTKLNSEIANGRLAMTAIIALFFRDGLTGTAWGDGPVVNYIVRAFENELGVQAPDGFWDPLEFTSDGDEDLFKRRRTVEIKHGRVSMLACMGYMTPEITGKWPGYLSPSAGLKFADIPNGLAAVSKVPALGWLQILAWGGYCELSKEESAPGSGDYGFKLISSNDPEVVKRKLNAELANGRLAMMAIIGMFYQDGLTGSAWGDWSLYTDSPLRAFESELGVQAPVGYWDPLGLSKDGDEVKFKRRRASELKHGRICMYACLGYIVPEYFRFPGFLSVSENLTFADMPSGISGMFATPIAGGLQIFLFCGFLEVGLLRQDGGRAPGDFENCGNLGVPYAEGVMDSEARNRSLNAEIANGRLAMVAFMGMLFQNGTFGTTGPEMWLP